MRILASPALIGIVAMVAFAQSGWAQKSYTWQELRDRFLAANPTLQAGEYSIREAKAQEITAFLRPNPEYTLSTDGAQLFPAQGGWRPFSGVQFVNTVGYLHERAHKRELRLESAQNGTTIAQSQQSDLQRTLIFSLRSAFVQALQAKAVLALARENLAYYDQVLAVSGDRLKAGDIARVDYDRLQVQRVQYESDVVTGETNVRTAKIQLLALLNDRTPVDQFDVTGRFEYTEPTATLDELHRIALADRPDLRAAEEAIDKARTDYRLAVANGSTDPTFASWWSHNPSFNNLPLDANTIGASVSIPLRIFDRNQGEKARTQLDITRTQRLRDANEAQISSDVDSAFASLNSNLALLRRYRSSYLEQAAKVRDTIAFSYQRGGASLLDFLNAQSEYRTVQLSYLNLVGSFLTAASQLNLAVGREVIQ